MRAVAQIIACDIHPLNNTGPLNYLRRNFNADEAAINAWYKNWVVAGFDAIEALIKPGPYAFGSEVGLADICLVPQVFNARRFKVSLDALPEDRRSRRRLRQAGGLSRRLAPRMRRTPSKQRT